MRNDFELRFRALLKIYAFVLLWVWAGVAVETGTRYAGWFGIQFVALAVFAFAIQRVWGSVGGTRSRRVIPLDSGIMLWTLFLICVCLILANWYSLGSVPIMRAAMSNDAMEIVRIRQQVTDRGSTLFNYATPMMLKAVLPFLIVTGVMTRRTLFAVLVAVIGVFYGMSTLQKSYPLLVLIPLAVYFVASRRFWQAALVALACGFTVMYLTFLTNVMLPLIGIVLFWPCVAFIALVSWLLMFHTGVRDAAGRTLRSRWGVGGVAVLVIAVALAMTMSPSRLRDDLGESVSGVQQTLDTALTRLRNSMAGLADRVLFVPGEVVSQWFGAFPAPFAYENGCGYRFVAVLRHCEFINNPIRMYKYTNDDLVKEGVVGTLNGAHFAEEYANFGPAGLVLSSLLVSLVLAIIARVLVRTPMLLFYGANFGFLLMLSSSALHTTLLSGGWSLMILLCAVFSRTKETN